jgi:GT2 family glycosyltransferase
MPPLVSIIIANWNGQAYLKKCLDSLSGQTYRAFEIIVVDNGSTDGSAAWITENFPAVRLILNRHNLGFAAANNQGIRHSQGEYLATVNTDVWATPGWLAALVAALEQNPQFGMAASQMLFVQPPEIINSTGIGVDWCGMSWDRSSGMSTALVAGEVSDVFGPCAGAALYRRAMLDDIGLFDPTFFAYLEDVDLAWRARWHGWPAMYVPTAQVYHFHSATAGAGSPFKTYLLAKNKILLIAKNYPMPYLALCFPLIGFYELLSVAYAFTRGQGRNALAGRWAGIKQLRQALQERRKLQKTATVSGKEIFKLLQPAPWPWGVYQRYRYSQQRQTPSATSAGKSKRERTSGNKKVEGALKND